MFLCYLHVGPAWKRDAASQEAILWIIYKLFKLSIFFYVHFLFWNELTDELCCKMLTFPPQLHFTRLVKHNPVSSVIVAGTEGVALCKHKGEPQSRNTSVFILTRFPLSAVGTGSRIWLRRHTVVMQFWVSNNLAVCSIMTVFSPSYVHEGVNST